MKATLPLLFLLWASNFSFGQKNQIAISFGGPKNVVKIDDNAYLFESSDIHYSYADFNNYDYGVHFIHSRKKFNFSLGYYYSTKQTHVCYRTYRSSYDPHNSYSYRYDRDIEFEHQYHSASLSSQYNYLTAKTGKLKINPFVGLEYRKVQLIAAKWLYYRYGDSNESDWQNDPSTGHTHVSETFPLDELAPIKPNYGKNLMILQSGITFNYNDKIELRFQLNRQIQSYRKGTQGNFVFAQKEVVYGSVYLGFYL